MKTFAIFCYVVAFIAVVAGNNNTNNNNNTYCDLPCEDYDDSDYDYEHIGCDHDNNFDELNCPENATMVPITDSLKQLLVDAHNEKRNFIAGGGHNNHEPACRMATMQWDDELAYLAGLNVKQCYLESDECHNTNDFKYSGQNLALAQLRPGDAIDAAEQLRGAVQEWFNEVENSTQSIIDSYPEENEKEVSHFTVMVADRNIRLGCAAATYDEDGEIHFLTACNYATNNRINFPIYEKCDAPIKNCTSGKNEKYSNLCNEKEEYAVNEWS